jgi:hypothetical protein
MEGSAMELPKTGANLRIPRSKTDDYTVSAVDERRAWLAARLDH